MIHRPGQPLWRVLIRYRVENRLLDRSAVRISRDGSPFRACTNAYVTPNTIVPGYAGRTRQLRQYALWRATVLVPLDQDRRKQPFTGT